MRPEHLLIKKILLEGGNLSIGGVQADHLDLKVNKRSFMVPILNQLLQNLNAAFYKIGRAHV